VIVVRRRRGGPCTGRGARTCDATLKRTWKERERNKEKDKKEKDESDGGGDILLFFLSVEKNGFPQPTSLQF